MRFLLPALICVSCSQANISDNGATARGQSSGLSQQDSALGSTPAEENQEARNSELGSDSPIAPIHSQADELGTNEGQMVQNALGTGEASAANVKAAATAPAAPPPSFKLPAVENESVVRPTPIAGAYLRCRPLMENTETESALGCRMENLSGTRIETAAIANNVAYALSTLPASFTTTTAKLRPSATKITYDALIDINGTDAAQVSQARSTMELTVSYQGLRNGAADTTFKSKLSEVTLSSVAVGSPANWQNDCTQAACAFTDLATGLSWSTGAVPSGGMVNAPLNTCTDYSLGSAKWRMPTTPELLVARANGIATSPQTVNLNLQSGYYWGGGAGNGGTSTKIISMVDNSPVTFGTNRGSYYLICVAD